MAINLITARPGHGKSFLCVTMLLKFAEENKKNEALRDQGKQHDLIRPLFSNINGLDIDGVQPMPPSLAEMPTGSIAFIDECQKNLIFQAGYNKTKQGHIPIPEGQFPASDVDYLALHRHQGHDLYFITQSPVQINNYIKAFVETHFVPIRKNGAPFLTLHTFPNIVPNPERLSEHKIRSESTDSKTIPFKKEVFKHYKSTELDTHKFRIPKRVVLAVCLLLAGWIAVVALSKYNSNSKQQRQADREAAVLEQMKEAEAKNTTTASFQQAKQEDHRSEFLSDHIVKMSYDEDIRPAIILATATRCTASNKWGERLNITDAQCRKFKDDYGSVPRGRNLPQSFDDVPDTQLALDETKDLAKTEQPLVRSDTLNQQLQEQNT